MKNKKIMIIIAVTICILLLILLIVQAAINDSKKKNSNDISYNNQKNENYEKNVSTGENNNEINNNQINNNINITENIVENEETIIKTPNQLFKEYLLNEEWVAQNLYLKENCLGKAINKVVKQKAKYIKVFDNTFNSPVVFIYTECEAQNSNQCYVLTYNNGKIEVNPINEKSGHISHVEYKINARNKIIYKATTYSNSEEYIIYNITDKGIEKNCSIRKENKIVNSNVEYKYYFNEEQCQEQKYNSIKNQYIQELARGEEFRIISSTNIENSFSD